MTNTENQSTEQINLYTVVSLDVRNKWGIESDFEATNEDDAVTLAQAFIIKYGYGAERKMFYAFLAGSKELEDFISTHDFID